LTKLLFSEAVTVHKIFIVIGGHKNK